MPYRTVHRGANWYIHKVGGDNKIEGEALGKHRTLRQARAQITAINMSEHGLSKKPKKKNVGGTMAKQIFMTRRKWMALKSQASDELRSLRSEWLQNVNAIFGGIDSIDEILPPEILQDEDVAHNLTIAKEKIKKAADELSLAIDSEMDLLNILVKAVTREL